MIPPLTPDNETARRWLALELSKPEYAAARPTWFDLLSQRVVDWLDSLRLPTAGGGASAWLAVIGIVLVALVIAGALVRFGLPRLNRRARAERRGGEVADVRTAAQLRAAADRAANASNWELAVIERFRAVAASLAERTIVAVRPGTTAREVAAAASAAFPAIAAELHAAADVFDAARYLGRRMGSAEHARVRELDERLRQSSPDLTAVAR